MSYPRIITFFDQVILSVDSNDQIMIETHVSREILAEALVESMRMQKILRKAGTL
jgi:hypothetical protein